MFSAEATKPRQRRNLPEAEQHGCMFSANKRTATSSSSTRTESGLLIPSNAGFKAIVVLPLLLWWTCIAAGMVQHAGRPYGKVNHVLIDFDRKIFRTMGDILPAVVLFLRVIAAGMGVMGRPAAGQDNSKGAKAAAVSDATPSLLPSCVWVYLGAVVVRFCVYMLHLYSLGPSKVHLVSDHMLLAGMVMAVLQAELAAVFSDLCRMGAAARHQLERRSSWQAVMSTLQELLLALALLVDVLLMVCTCGDMFFTALYFHDPAECFATTALAFVLFQAPGLRWLYCRRVTAL